MAFTITLLYCIFEVKYFLHSQEIAHPNVRTIFEEKLQVLKKHQCKHPQRKVY